MNNKPLHDRENQPPEAAEKEPEVQTPFQPHYGAEKPRPNGPFQQEKGKNNEIDH